MRSFMQNNCAVFITKLQFLKRCQYYLLFQLVIFHRSLKLYYRKICVTCCVRGRREKNSKTKEFADSLLFLIYHWKFWPNFKETIDSTYPITSFKDEGFSPKSSASFRLLKIMNISCLLRGISLLKKAPANEVTELLAFTECKFELRVAKRLVLQSRFRRTGFWLVVNNRQNRRKATCNKTKRSRGAIAEVGLQGGALDGHEISNWTC